jgi:hypothetical protein
VLVGWLRMCSGYIAAQIPGGLVAGRVGGKAVMTWISYAMAAALLALPAVAGGTSARPAALCLAAIGVAQAPMRPAQTLMTYNWVPQGPSRAYYMMVISLGSAMAKLAAAVVVPALCASRGGWRSAAWVLAGSFGGFNLLWQLLATELPPPESSVAQPEGDRAQSTAKAGAAAEGGSEPDLAPAVSSNAAVAVEPPVDAAQQREPGIREMFFAAPFQAIIWSHSIKDLIDVHTFGNWAPTFLHLQHGVPLGAGKTPSFWATIFLDNTKHDHLSRQARDRHNESWTRNERRVFVAGRVGAYLIFPSLCSIGGKILQAPFESRLTARAENNNNTAFFEAAVF